MRPFLYVLVILLLPLFSYGVQEPYISISKITPEGGVAYSQVTSIIEDEQGFIWFSTNNGLFRYTSIDLTRYGYLQKDATTISTNRINTLYTDNFGKMWVATENGLCSYNARADSFKRYFIHDQFNSEIGKDIISFFQDHKNSYWFSDKKGIGTVDPHSGRAVYQNVNNKTNEITFATIGDDQTIWIFYDDGEIYYKLRESSTFQFFTKGFKNSVQSVLLEENFIWIGYESEGLLCVSKTNGSKTLYSQHPKITNNKLPGNQVRSLLKDEKGQIWAATNNGIAIIKSFEVNFLVDKRNYPELPHNSVWALFQDSNKNIWMGTWLGGLAFHSKYNNSFQHYTQANSPNALSSNIVSCFAQVPSQQQILVGTDDGDLNLFDIKTKTFSTYPIFFEGDTIKRVKSATYDKTGTLWVGTYRNGVLYKEKDKIAFKRLNPPFDTGFQALDLLATEEGLWVSNYPLGAYFYQFESKSFTAYRHNPLDINSISNDYIRHILQDKNGDLWFATEHGLNQLRKGTTTFIRTFNQPQNPESISSNYIYDIYEDSQGYFWLGTNSEGLDRFDPKTGVAEHFTQKSGLPGNEIFSLLEDQEDNLWIATENGLCKFNPSSNILQSFLSDKGIRNNHFYPTAALKSTDGELYFGGSNGFIRFKPEVIVTNPIPPTTTITSLYIHNKEIKPQAGRRDFNDVMSDFNPLKLTYKQNSISFQFISNNYVDPRNVKYKYRLLGFEDQWIDSDYIGRATFTNIPPGDYFFEVKASNNYGLWNDVPTSLALSIIPPIWMTWYAYLIYFLLFGALAYFIRKQALNRQELKMAIKMGSIQREKEEELHHMKLEFFTDISHEFRTPLTLIQGPVNRLLKEGGYTNEKTNKQLSLIKKNTDRLLNLINQFLDFRRVEYGKLKLNPIHTDAVSFCKNVFDCFAEHAQHRSFQFNFVTKTPSIPMDFDAEKLDKVLVNLLSNAFKYSPDYGNISLKIAKNKKSERKTGWDYYSIGDDVVGDFVEISITDFGQGISSDKLPKIFERFFQIENNDKRISSTGIGLSLSTNYIKLHNGQLVVSSVKEKGAAFFIYLPLVQANTIRSGRGPIHSNTPYAVASELNADQKRYAEQAINNQESLILIVEDNIDLLEFLEESLQEHFRVAKAKNGKQAYELALSLYPDLIISDIMMPEMDGIQLCEKIKNDIKTSHIPVILLTALESVQNKMTGIRSGADAYVPKPFDEEFIIVQTNNLLNSRKTLRALFTSEIDQWERDSNALSLDKQLLTKAIHIIEKNLTNGEFTVEYLAKNLGLSRTHLHRKLKSLTNQSATEFIRSIRLKHAIKLFKSENYKINEIGFAVGFNSHNYFTKAFKKQYGVSPSEFLKENSKSIVRPTKSLEKNL